MPRGYTSHNEEFDTLIKGLFTSRGNGHGVTRQEEEVAAAMTDALAESMRRVLSRATPFERALFVEALAPALAEALAPALADALGDAIAPAKVGAQQGKAAPEKETGTTEPPHRQDKEKK
jgi:hypothetical protein